MASKRNFLGALVFVGFLTLQASASPTVFNAAVVRQDELAKKVGRSYEALETGFMAIGKNFEEFGKQWLKQFAQDLEAFYPITMEFFEAIPAKAIHKLTLDSMQLVKKQAEDHCGKVLLKYNPLHPELELRARSRRETSKMTLTKFGSLLSNLLRDFDLYVQNYVTDLLPAACEETENGLTLIITEVQSMTPDEFKDKIWFSIRH